jgi:hypothetical protein
MTARTAGFTAMFVWLAATLVFALTWRLWPNDLRLLFRAHGDILAAYASAVALNVFAAAYRVVPPLALLMPGAKLRHVTREIADGRSPLSEPRGDADETETDR